VQPYIDVLPSRCSNAVFFTARDFELLSASRSVAVRCASFVRTMAKYYCYLASASAPKLADVLPGFDAGGW
jgi:hypothetical protein